MPPPENPMMVIRQAGTLYLDFAKRLQFGEASLVLRQLVDRTVKGAKPSIGGFIVFIEVLFGRRLWRVSLIEEQLCADYPGVLEKLAEMHVDDCERYFRDEITRDRQAVEDSTPQGERK